MLESAPAGEVQVDTGQRALQLRIRQQEILAELGVAALRGTPFLDLLNEAVRLSAEGLKRNYKVLNMPSENRLMRAGLAGIPLGWHCQRWGDLPCPGAAPIPALR